MSADTIAPTKVTRGHGLLEPLLSRKRAAKANNLISQELRGGRILDVGCGSYPYFLAHTAFKEKFAIDQLPPSVKQNEINWHVLNLNEAPKLPFADGFFSVVTLLAVAEHVNPISLERLLGEAHRVLQPGGRVILTTPAAWSDGLLKFMARVGLVSAEEIDEHVFAYTLPLLGWYFGRAGFAMQQVHFGYFEFGLNLWAMAER
jgi:SAM-dependent methyltransferase